MGSNSKKRGRKVRAAGNGQGRQRMGFPLPVLLLCMCGLCLCACAGQTYTTVTEGGAEDSGASGEDKVIRIGVLEPLSGENEAGGTAEAMGIRYAHEIRPVIRIGGEEYRVELVEADDCSNSSVARESAQKLVAEGVSVVLGSYGSGASLAAAEVFQEAGIPAIAGSCTSPEVTMGNDCYFRLCFQDPFQGSVLADYCIQNSYDEATILTQEGDAYSTGLGSYFKEAFLQMGGTVVGELQIPRVEKGQEGQSGQEGQGESGEQEGSKAQEEREEQGEQEELRVILSEIMAQNPDVVFAPVSPAMAPVLIRETRAMGIRALLMGGDTWEEDGLIEEAGEDAEGVVFSAFLEEQELPGEEAASFAEGFRAYLAGQGQTADFLPSVSILGYDAYQAAIAAIEEAGSAEGETVKETLRSLSLGGVSGVLSFDEEGNAKDRDTLYIKTVKDGAFLVLRAVRL